MLFKDLKEGDWFVTITKERYMRLDGFGYHTVVDFRKNAISLETGRMYTFDSNQKVTYKQKAEDVIQRPE